MGVHDQSRLSPFLAVAPIQTLQRALDQLRYELEKFSNSIASSYLVPQTPGSELIKKKRMRSLGEQLSSKLVAGGNISRDMKEVLSTFEPNFERQLAEASVQLILETA